MANLVVYEVLSSKIDESVIALDYADDKENGLSSTLFIKSKEIDEETYKKIEEEAKNWSYYLKCYDNLDRWGFDDYQDHVSWDETHPLLDSSIGYIFLVKDGKFFGVAFYNDDYEMGALTILGFRYGAVKYKSVESEGNTDIERGKYYYLIRNSEEVIYVNEGVSIINEGEYSCSRNLKEVHIPHSVTYISSRAFSNCPNLNKVYLSSKTRIDNNAFINSSDVELYITINEINDLLIDPIERNNWTHLLNESGEEITKIIIPKGIEEIPDYAFSCCRNLIEVEFPSSIKRIGYKAFYCCLSLKTINLPLSLETIEDYAFYNCDNVELTIPINAITKENSFSGTTINKKTLIIGDDNLITSFGYVNLPSSNDTHLLTTLNQEVDELNIKEGIADIPSRAFESFNNVKKINLPSTLISIGEWAFHRCKSLTSIHFPDGLKVINKWAFNSTGLKEVIFPKEMELIDKESFAYCYQLKKVVMPQKLNNIGIGVFHYCKIDSLNVPEGIVELEKGFLSEIDAPFTLYLSKTVKIIHDEAFESIKDFKAIYGYYGLKLDEYHAFKYGNRPNIYLIYPNFNKDKDNVCLSYPATLVNEDLNPIYYELTIDKGTIIKEKAYCNNYSVTKVTIDGNIKEIGNRAFYFCKNLKEVIFNTKIDRIGEEAFFVTNIEKLSIPKGVKRIEYRAFEACHNLKEIYIPTELEYIGPGAFSDDENINKITFPISAYQVGYNTIDYYQNAVGYFIINKTDNDYTKNRNFKVKEGHLLTIDNKEIEEINVSGSVNEIAYYAFSNFNSIKKINILEGVTKISNNAFSNMKGLVNVTFPKSLQLISYNGFSDCPSLESIEFNSDGRLSLYNSFVNCVSLKRAAFNCGVSLSESTFENCINLKEIYIKHLETSINSNTFKNCKSLINFEVDECVSIDSFAFEGCEKLESVVVQDDLKFIYANVFKDCKSLKTISIPNTLKIIHDGAFNNSGLEEINYNGTKRQWSKVKQERQYSYSNDFRDSMLHNKPVKEIDDDFTPIEVIVHCLDGDVKSIIK